MLKIAWSPVYRYQLPEGHRFPMLKYELLPEQLLYEGSASDDNFFEPAPLARETALRVHTPEYWNKLERRELSSREERAIGFPINEKFIVRGRHISQGTIDCALYALEHGVALNTAGGTHHAFADRGEGYCCFNDQAVAARYLLDRGLARRILVIDLDVHQAMARLPFSPMSRGCSPFRCTASATTPCAKSALRSTSDFPTAWTTAPTCAC